MTSIEVIGAGLMRTGTNSLQVALERLLNGKCYHMYVLVRDSPSDVNFWLKACTESPSDEEWLRFLASYKAVVDFPPVAFYERFVQLYPNAKVILTVRDPDTWFKSVSQTIAIALHDSFFASIITYFTSRWKFLKMVDLLFKRVYGDDYDLKNKERMVKAFEAHNQRVLQIVPKDRLLVFEIKQGWQPLCDFLGVPVPDEPFPHVNSREDFVRGNLRKFSLLKPQILLPVIVGVAIAVQVYRTIR